MLQRVMALRVVTTVWGDSSWQLDHGQVGRVGEETWGALRLAAGLFVDILMVDMVLVIVVSAVEVTAETMMFESVSVSWMAVHSREEIVKLVGCVWWVVNQTFQLERSQGERG
jgi:hypothetical protein